MILARSGERLPTRVFGGKELQFGWKGVAIQVDGARFNEWAPLCSGEWDAVVDWVRFETSTRMDENLSV